MVVRVVVAVAAAGPRVGAELSKFRSSPTVRELDNTSAAKLYVISTYTLYLN